MQLLPFTELQQLIDERLDSPDIGRGKIFHYYKILQHAITYEVTNTTHKIIPHRLDKPIWFQQMMFALRSYRRKERRSKLKEIVLLDDGRTGFDKDGKEQSYYFSKIIDTIGADKISVIRDHQHRSGLIFEVGEQQIESFGNKHLDATERKVLEDVVMVYKNSKHKIGAAYLGTSLHLFFEEFHRYYRLFKGQGVKTLLMTNHYHREGIIAAAKMLNIQVVEFQHGLIAAEDLYYVYHDMAKDFAAQAIFPDQLVLFGQYWKSVIAQGHEYDPKNLIIAGDYSLQTDGWEKYQGREKVKAVFIGAQKNMPKDYVAYAESLLRTIEEKHPEWQLWIKLHPYEKEPELYEHLNDHPNCTVYGKTANLMDLLSQSLIQISVYSTTFFDAMGLGVENMSLQNYTPGADYAASMARQGIATPIEFDDDPISLYQSGTKENKVQRPEVYGPYNPQAIAKLIS
ncbi:hypothetical protein [Sanyastnella coralliicola]|uniref:hypothetical protein n=1 Tax=Sanyastnella coralliicola TaxID=3069118 RepID=UPI0027B932C1|nr:hypothetical protein [Longitalea sp. SCSIO 12813]